MTTFQPAHLTAADRLLLLCAHVTLAPAQQQDLAHLLDAGLDWGAIVQRAAVHKIYPHVHGHLHAAGAGPLVPEPLWQELTQSCARAAARNMLQRAEAARLLHALHGAGIEAIPLKALALWDTVYPQPALRVAGDLDLLVRPGAVQPAAAVLHDLGYGPDEHYDPDWYQPERMHHLVPYSLPGRPVYVEIHWDLAPAKHGFEIDVDGLWQRAVPGTAAGAPVLRLSPEDAVLHLGFHTAAGERFFPGLRALMDVAETVRLVGPELDWPLLAARGRAWRAWPIVYLALLLADDLLGIDGLAACLAPLEPEGFRPELLGAARHRVLSLQAATRMPGAAHMLHSVRAEPLPVKLRLLGQRLFLPRHEMSRRYGIPASSPRLLPYYALYLAGLLRWRNVRLALDLARGRRAAHTADYEGTQQEMLLDHWLETRRFPIP